MKCSESTSICVYFQTNCVVLLKCGHSSLCTCQFDFADWVLGSNMLAGFVVGVLYMLCECVFVYNLTIFSTRN